MAHDPSKMPAALKTVRTASCFGCQGRERNAWCDLEEPELRLLNDSKICNLYQPGQVIFYEGNPCLGIHCIESGEIALRKATGTGETVVIGLRGAGETLGYRAYFAGSGYNATAEVLRPSRVCFIDKAAVRTLLHHNPNVGLGFLRKFADDLGKSEVERVLALSLPLRARLAHMLLVLKDRSASVDDDGTLRIDLPLSRRDLASMLGARPESLSRVIRDLTDRSVARFEARRVIVPDLDVLIDEVEQERESRP